MVAVGVVGALALAEALRTLAATGLDAVREHEGALRDRLVAGLEPPTRGRLLVDGKEVTGTDPSRTMSRTATPSPIAFPPRELRRGAGAGA